MKRLVVAVLVLATALYGQNENDGEKLITVPKKYVSPEGVAHKVDATTNIGAWAGIGREIGIATKEGLNAVVDVSERFGATNVGRFVMVMVAWKIAGHDLLKVVIGVPIFIAGWAVWIWSFRRFFFGYTRLAKYDKATKTKEWVKEPAYKFESGDGKAGCGVLHALFIAVWNVVMLLGILA